MTHDDDAHFMRHHRNMRNVVIIVMIAVICFAVLAQS